MLIMSKRKPIEICRIITAKLSLPPCKGYPELTHIGPFPVVSECPPGAVTIGTIPKEVVVEELRVVREGFKVRRRLMEACQVLRREVATMFRRKAVDIGRGMMVSDDGQHCLMLIDDGTVNGGVQFSTMAAAEKRYEAASQRG
jgi:hypothetical protein